MDAFLVVLAVSFPVFYIWGMVGFFRWLSGLGTQAAEVGQSASQVTRLRGLITYLSQHESERPGLTVAEEIVRLRGELRVAEGESVVTRSAATGGLADVQTQTGMTALAGQAGQWAGTTSWSGQQGQERSDWWEGWYEQHSIDLLLYIGAFLILAAAAIFVGYQWGSIGGVMKALWLLGVMVAFGGAGLGFYQVPRIRQAGAVFTGIGALLVPLVGAAWYVFVLRDLGVSVGLAWLITSLVTVGVHVAMLVYFKQTLYAYLASLSGISVVLSLVRVFGLPQETFVTAGIVGCLGLLVGYLKQPVGDRWREFGLTPMRLTSQVCLPIFLVYGLYITMADDTFFSLTTAGTLLLATGYYWLSYGLDRQPWQLLVALGLGPLAGVSWEGSTNWPSGLRMYILDGFGLIWLILAAGLRRMRLASEWQGSLLLGLALFGVAFGLSFGQSSTQQVLVTGLAILALLLASTISRRIEWLYGALALLAWLTFVWLGRVWVGLNWLSYLAALYWVYGLACFGLAMAARQGRSLLMLAATGVTSYVFLALLLAFGQPWLVVAIVASGLVMAIVSAYWFVEMDLLLVAGVCGFGLALALLWALKAPEKIYPLSMILIAVGEYGLSLLVRQEAGKRWQQSSLVASIVLPLIFYVHDVGLWSDGGLTGHWWSLWSVYGAVGLITWQGWMKRQTAYWYGASVMGALGYIWQLQVLGVTEVQWYCVPVGMYCLALSWLRRRANDSQNADWLDAVGLLLIVGVTTVMAFAADSPVYALLLIIYGVALVGAGIHWRRQLYRTSGLIAIVFGVVARTYSYFFMLPKWLIVGLLGLGLLAVAMWLMWKKEGADSSKP